MMAFSRLSLRQRLLLWLLPALLLLTAIWGVVAYAIVIHFTRSTYDWVLEDAAHTLAGQVRNDSGVVTVMLPPDARRMLEFDQVDDVYFSVSDRSGHQIAGNRTLPPSPEARSGERGRTLFYDGDLGGQPVRLAEYAMLTTAGDLILIRVAETVRKRSVLARRIIGFIMVPQLLLLAGIVLLAWLGIGRGIAPLKRIREAISRRTPYDLSPLDETGLPQEVHEQVRVINDLMHRLGETLAAQRRFIADAAHQLRTPITVIRAQAELALRTDDPAQTRTTVTKLAEASARLARIANQLLNLSRAETGLAGSMDVAPFRPSELVEDVVARLVPAALEKRIDLSVEVEDGLPPLRANRVLLGEMLANLVDNAIRYARPGDPVSVRLRRRGDWIHFIIADGGPGIDEPERERVLQRFYRTEDAGSEGSGLGLPIAQEIAKAHGGRLSLAATTHDSGLTVVVEIPSIA